MAEEERIEDYQVESTLLYCERKTEVEDEERIGVYERRKKWNVKAIEIVLQKLSGLNQILDRKERENWERS